MNKEQNKSGRIHGLYRHAVESIPWIELDDDQFFPINTFAQPRPHIRLGAYVSGELHEGKVYDVKVTDREKRRAFWYTLALIYLIYGTSVTGVILPAVTISTSISWFLFPIAACVLYCLRSKDLEFTNYKYLSFRVYELNQYPYYKKHWRYAIVTIPLGVLSALVIYLNYTW